MIAEKSKNRLRQFFHDEYEKLARYIRGLTDDTAWGPGDSRRNWRYYQKFWNDKGKDTFESYIRWIKSEKEKQE